MAEEIYEQLVEALMKRGGAIPPVKCKEFYALVEELFTNEQAEVAVNMPMGPVSAEQIARETGIPIKEIEPLLEKMADQGLLFSRKKDGVTLYTMLQLVPGISEYQFMRGGTTERDKKLAMLFEKMHHVTWGAPEAEKNRPTFPFSRVITIEENISSGTTVHPYDKVSEYIKGADYIAQGTCFCRHQAELLGNPCDKPKDTCLTFGPTAQYVDERGIGRLVSKEEAMDILDRSEKAGLVHCSSNVSDRIDFICNCCICHCGIIQTFKDKQKINFGAPSNYIVSPVEGACNGCETCIEMCPIDALFLNDDDAVELDDELCIGCGLCVSACPSNALEMVIRSKPLVPPKSFRELMTAVAASTKRQ
ncbi:MAG: 4Fe-4S dicluster domain-containing protein [Desulfobacterales bacterium]